MQRVNRSAIAWQSISLGFGERKMTLFGRCAVQGKQAALLLCLVVAGLVAAPEALAQVYSTTVERKIAPDLRQVALRGQLEQKRLNWLSKEKGQWLVKVLIVSNDDSDAEALKLRIAVLGAGGSVYHRYLSVNAVLAVIPVNQVANIANRADVESVSPNRLTAQSASFEEQITGAASVRAAVNNTGMDGRGVGIAFIDSGIMRDHLNFVGSTAESRVVRSVGFGSVGDNKASKAGFKGWETGVDYSMAMIPGTKAAVKYQESVDRSKSKEPDDEYGHGTFVAGVAAGLGRSTATDSTGIAPGASLFDLKVLNEEGVGQVSDVLAAIDWVLFNHKDLNIRVMNVSLASDSTESYLTDPLCRAVRAAVASGITVVVAAGNYGKDADGKELYGSIASPANEPSVITVGSAKPGDTVTRVDDRINDFSSRGPTRGGLFNANGERVPDNLLKPDLVAPGNAVISAEAALDPKNRGNNLTNNHPRLRVGSDTRGDRGIMRLSGTSVAAPAVSGTAALMLQANPGLTPPLIKAALQYSAQPLAGASLIQQGAGLLNVEGAVRIAQSLRTDIATAIRAGRIRVGDSLLAPGKTLPSPSSNLNNEQVAWSRLVFAGGSSVLSGNALLTQYQAFYDPRLLWVRDRVRAYRIAEWPAPDGMLGLRYYFRYMQETFPYTGQLTTPNLQSANALAGDSNAAMRTGVFAPTMNLSSGVAQGVGKVMAEGLSVSSGGVRGNSMSVLGEGVVFKDGQSTGVGKVMAEGLTNGVGKVMAESGQTKVESSSNIDPMGER
jgi:serine protease AprX